MSKYKLIIFDCDGTLVDTETLLNDACSQVLTNMGFKQYTPEYCLEKFIGISLSDMLDMLYKELGDNFNKQEFLAIAAEVTTKLVTTQVQPMPHTNELLEKLGNFPRCVASNGIRTTVVQSLKTAKLYSYFTEETIFTYELVKHPKPAPDLFLYAAEQMGFTPHECLVIEDSIVGVTAAKAANMDVLAYKHLSDKLLPGLSELKPTAIIRNLKEILNFI